MSSADGPDRAHSLDFGNAGEHRGSQVDTQLIEALIHVLIEKGVLTRNDALNVVQTDRPLGLTHPVLACRTDP